MYIVTKGKTRRQYETTEPHKAIAAFIKETSANLEDVFIRSFGGSNQPASKLWPRSRTSRSHETAVQ